MNIWNEMIFDNQDAKILYINPINIVQLIYYSRFSYQLIIIAKINIELARSPCFYDCTRSLKGL